jgi:hypothetical protein
VILQTSVIQSVFWLEIRMDRLALKFHETRDLIVRDEIYRLARELIKLDEPWKFVVS